MLTLRHVTGREKITTHGNSLVSLLQNPRSREQNNIICTLKFDHHQFDHMSHLLETINISQHILCDCQLGQMYH
uniref:Uncharacterized protein n=1 Tax=Anguilla anguilla TaxID=7936 RepID=A0A0E9R7Z5_ANGAN